MESKLSTYQTKCEEAEEILFTYDTLLFVNWKYNETCISIIQNTDFFCKSCINMDTKML